ncbi:heterokaryon incompatibility protein-domain-containing protein [Nemania sp. FL0031]|nr:heterokaryon incompatibility protein-domain-containing protein [Nemania sp. FL0031]
MATTRDIIESELEITHNGLMGVKQSHDSHGHPPLTDPGTEFWMKWDEWNPGLMEKNQHNQIKRFEAVFRPGLEWFLGIYDKLGLGCEPLTVSFPKPPPRGASYAERQSYLIDSFEIALSIALPAQSDTTQMKQRFLQKSLDQYRVLYQQLNLGNDSNMIRLLGILPGSPNESRVETRLFNASLESPGTSYEALSYAWGAVQDPQHLQTIRINGLTQRVTPNLYSALSSLRKADHSRILWVDSICINQGDLGERTQQIMLMARIYAKAERTVVYLGPSTATSTALFRFMNLPLCRPSKCKRCGLDRTLIESLHNPLEACTTNGLEESEVLEGFIDVCRREWWNRVWILQEFTLSKQDPTFYCGRDAVANRLLGQNFYKIYEWVSHRKHHPTRLDTCDHFACNESDLAEGHSHTLIGSLGRKGEEAVIIDEVDSSQTMWTVTQEQENDDGDDDKSGFGKPIEIPEQNQSSREWASWGVSAWEASTVLQRRSTCRPWHAPDYLYRSLRAHCTDRRDIVYGVRELMDPTFRDIFKPNYTVPVSKLYTKLSAYMLLFHSWPDMFYYYPYRLSSSPSAFQPETDIPSWVPDFTIPVKVKEAEKGPASKESDVIADLHGPYIIDCILFMSGVLLDEIVDVFPLPQNDPFKLLQQLWYLERLYGCPGYELFDQDLPGGPESSDRLSSSILELQGISAYPSIAWATRYSDFLPQDVSIVHVIAKAANLNNLSGAMTEAFNLIRVHLEQQFEKEGKKTGSYASPEESDEWQQRYRAIGEPLSDLLISLGDKWFDWVGICTFDFENLCAQVRHQLIPMMAWTPSRLPGHNAPYEEGVNKCDPPFTSAVFQRPVIYSSILKQIAKDVESDSELEIRREAVVLLAKAMHDATTPVVGYQGEVHYTKLDSEHKDSSVGEENIDILPQFDNGANEVDEAVQPIISDLLMAALPEDVTTVEYRDTPVVGYLVRADEIHDTNRIDNYLEKIAKTGDIEGGEEEGHVTSHSSKATNDLEDIHGGSNSDDSMALNQRKFGTLNLGSGDDTHIEDGEALLEKAFETQQSPTDSMHPSGEGSSPRNVPIRPQAASRSKKKPTGKPLWWRRTERRKPAKFHTLFGEVIDFLSGRKFFITETHLLGLTGPGEQDVCDGDDLLLFRGMSFPVIARLEPLKELGNPKRRRRDLPTMTNMHRKILGTAIVRGIDPKGGDFDKVELPVNFEPLSGVQPQYFTFK